MATLERWTMAGPVQSPSTLTVEQLEQEEARAAVTVGEAAPLGLLGFATATFTVSAINTGYFSPSALMYAVPILLIFGGLVQFIAAMWSYRKGDTFAATAFGSFGTFNTTFAFYELLLKPTSLGGTPATTPVVGIWIACFSFIALFLAIGALRRNVALFLVLIALAGAYGFISASLFYFSNSLLLEIAGWCGIASSILAFYTAMAMVLNSVTKQGTVPLGSMSPSAAGSNNSHASEAPTTVRESVH